MTETTLKLWLTAALITIDTVWIATAGYSFDLTSLAACVAGAGALASVGYIYTRVRPDERLGAMGTETAFLAVFSAAACVFSYLMTTLDRPLIDGTLAQWDTDLGFNWYAYIAFANTHHWVGALSSLLYQTTLTQVALAVIILPMLGQLDRVREMTMLVMASSVLCVVVSGILPSEGALAYYHPSAAFYMQSHPVVDLAYKQQFFDIRHGLMTHLGLTDIKGLVAFPSYHVALSAILMIAFRGLRMFWPVVVVNTLVILSTPIDGGHHLTDGLGGAALAFATAMVVIRLRSRLRAPVAQPLENYEELAPQQV